MFTIQQINERLAQVKSGADFPAYIQAIRELGVIRYETFVADGHTNYYGTEDYQLSSSGKYDDLKIAQVSNADQFSSDLKAHQQGKSDYITFCHACAKSGIEKWVVSIDAMTCTYYDKSGEILIEEIPQ